MKNLNFPISLKFKISTLANDFSATDANGRTIAYVRQKLFKIKEVVEVFNDESKSQVNYRINADSWFDFNTAYAIKNSQGVELGKIARKGWASIWKASYELVGVEGEVKYHIRENNPWIKVADSLFENIPILGGLSGYLFNPSYNVTDLNGEVITVLKKKQSFFGRKFEVQEVKVLEYDDELILLSLMMMVLLERRRG